MADVLSIIRDYTIHKKEIIEKDDDVIFGDFAYPKSARTNYIIWGTNKPDSSKDYYTLECVLYLLRHVHLNHAQYVRQAAAAGVPVVRLPDRKDLLNYLTGEAASSDKIDRSAPLDMSGHRPVAAKRAPADGPAEVATEAAGEAAAGEDGGSDATAAAASLAKRPRLAGVGDLDGSAVGSAASAAAAVAAAAEPVDAEAEQLAVQRALKERERLQAKLDETAGRPTVLPQLFESSSLRQVMSLEKIHALRAKRRVKIRDSIKPDEGGAAGAAGGTITGAAGDATGRPAGTFFSEDLGLLRELVSRERLHRDRNTCLQAASRNFADSVLNGVLRAVRSREEGAAAAAAVAASGGGQRHHQPPHRQSTGPAGAGGGGGHSRHGSQPVQHMQYSRYDQEKFANRDEAAAYFQIDTTGWGIDVLGRTPGGGGGGAGEMRPSDPRRLMQQRQSAGSTGGGGGIRTAGGSVGSAPVSPASSVVSGGGGGTPTQQQKRTSRTPIVIIPATASLISMLNAKDILLDKRFVSIEDKRAAGARRENEALIQRMRPDGTTVPFRVVDQPQKLTPDEWQRVVAVFVQGPAWQFKAWPVGGGNPVDIFVKVKAFHLKFSDLPTDPNVRKWNVTVLPLDRHKRHLDRAVLQQFWDELELHMRKHKSHLRF